MGMVIEDNSHTSYVVLLDIPGHGISCGTVTQICQRAERYI